MTELDRYDLSAVRRALTRLVQTRPMWTAHDEWTYQRLARREAVLLGRSAAA